jgi:hypothetical protein
MRLQDHQVYRKKADVVLRHVAGEVLLVPIRGQLADMDRIYILNETGERVWELLDGARPVSALAQAICEHYDVTLSEALQDVKALVEDLAAAGLLEQAS